jgi:hypothetical protein
MEVVVIFIPQPLNRRNSLNRRLAEPQSYSGRFGEEENIHT